MLHRLANRAERDDRLQIAELDYATSSRAGAAALAENYVGLPFED